MARQLCLLFPFALGKQLSSCALRPHTHTIPSVPPRPGQGKGHWRPTGDPQVWPWEHWSGEKYQLIQPPDHCPSEPLLGPLDQRVRGEWVSDVHRGALSLACGCT